MRVVILIFFVTTLFSACKEKEHSLTGFFTMPDYPSGSGIAYHDKKLYLMGDDASYLMITDTAFKTLDTISFFASETKRIPKEIKKDSEAAAIVSVNRIPSLMMIGSGSGPARNYCWIFDPITKEKTEIALDTFYNRLKKAGLKNLNIEGLTEIPGGILLASRGNKSSPKNYLIFTSNAFWKDQANTPFYISLLGATEDTTAFIGVSGLEYSRLSDRLLLTTSTENTYSSLGDGEIGKSFIWIIHDITSKKNYSGINPAIKIDLETIDKRFSKQKIESLCIISENNKRAEVVLVSDDDKGGSVIFKLLLKSKR
ncbi:MAG: hypothetical protein WKF35_02215 [Ferruginibacter sp.]